MLTKLLKGHLKAQLRFITHKNLHNYMTFSSFSFRIYTTRSMFIFNVSQIDFHNSSTCKRVKYFAVDIFWSIDGTETGFSLE